LKIVATLIPVLIVSFAVAQVEAQLPIGGHSQIGGAGVLTTTALPPGVYLRDANLLYISSRTPGLAVNLDVLAYIQQPRLFWITPFKILGGTYGMSVSLPSAYIKVNGPIPSHGHFSLADPPVEPLLVSWSSGVWDAVASYSVFVPVGEFNSSTPLARITSAGKGFWSHVVTFGGLWRAGEDKTWGLSLLNRYEMCCEQNHTQITPGDMITMEWGLSKRVGGSLDVGFIGYYQQQVTADTGVRAVRSRSEVVGIGPEIRYIDRKDGIAVSLRYFYEVEAHHHPQGSIVSLTVAKRF
jgi:hypothetical protein